MYPLRLLCLLSVLFGAVSIGGQEATDAVVENSADDDKKPFKKLEFFSPMKNYSRATGEALKLKCEVSGGNPEADVVFRWFLNEAPLQEEKGRIKVKDSVQGDIKWSRIRFRDLEVMDTGIYR